MTRQHVLVHVEGARSAVLAVRWLTGEGGGSGDGCAEWLSSRLLEQYEIKARRSERFAEEKCRASGSLSQQIKSLLLTAPRSSSSSLLFLLGSAQSVFISVAS